MSSGAPRPRKIEKHAPAPIPDVEVQIRRDPWDPKKETDQAYADREEFIVTFDVFREESKISPDREATLLAILWEYQEASKRYLEEALYWNRLGYPGLAGEDNSLYVLADRLEEFLTPEEARVWFRTMDMTSYWLSLKHAHGITGRDYLTIRQPAKPR